MPLTSGKRGRPTSFAGRPLGTQATLAQNAARARDLAMEKESKAKMEALQILAGATAHRNLVAALSAPANRDIPRFRDFLDRRADALMAEHMAGIVGVVVSTGHDGSSAGVVAAAAAGEAAHNRRVAAPTAAAAAAAAARGSPPNGASAGAAAAAAEEATKNRRREALAAAAAGGGDPDGLCPGAAAAAADMPAANGRRAPALTLHRGGLGAA